MYWSETTMGRISYRGFRVSLRSDGVIITQYETRNTQYKPYAAGNSGSQIGGPDRGN